MRDRLDYKVCKFLSPKYQKRKLFPVESLYPSSVDQQNKSGKDGLSSIKKLKSK
ncbi:MAG: hypothetical protein NC918_07880 [Candidatus Omnitrophica bacterium]|nr:hypothetical protein [Candidatus Omnitrophota bacterium]